MAARVARPQVAAVSIAIPSLDLSGPLDELGVADDGELLAPDDPARAGWYAGGVVPGDLGPAIIGGHVDSRRGPGVFFALRSLRPGDVVEITRSDGRVARFAVSRVQQVAKDRFPTAAVYGPTPGPSCGSSPAGAASTARRAVTPTTWSSRRWPYDRHCVIRVRTEQNTASDRRVYRLSARRENPLNATSAVRACAPPFCATGPDRAGISIPGRPALSPPRSVPHDDSRS